MEAWVANAVALSVFAAVLALASLALLWRVGSWGVPRLVSLMEDEGLALGSIAPEIAGHSADRDIHLSFFGGPLTFLAFGMQGCAPCTILLETAASHPATRNMRLVYFANSEDVEADPEAVDRWEIYRFHNERLSREQWRVPVSPYFHVIDEYGRIAEKGVGHSGQHLDRLLSLRPPTLRLRAPQREPDLNS